MTAEAAAPSGKAFRARIVAAGAASGAGRGALLAGACPAFHQLCTPPPWLVLPEHERMALAERAALSLAAPGLARCLDGRILGPLADAFGDETLAAVLDGAVPDEGAPPMPLERVRERAVRLLADATCGNADAEAQLTALIDASEGSA